MADRSNASRIGHATRPASDWDLFPDDEAPTRPAGPSHQFNRLANAYRALTQADRLWLDRLVELMAYASRE
jgi:hypothetical protein